MILPASKLVEREGRVPVEAKPGVAKVSITVATDPAPVSRLVADEVARWRACGLRMGRGLGLGLGGGLS